MSDHSFIVWHDSLGSEPNIVECLSYEKKAKDGFAENPDGAASGNGATRDGKQGVNKPPLAAGDFVIINDTDQGMEWLAQVIEPQRNLPLQGLSRESPSAVAVFERILAGEINRSIFLNQVYYYRLQLIGEVTKSGRLSFVRRRPRAGSVGHIASAQEVIKALDLPAIHKNSEREDQNNIVGRIHTTSIPLAINWPTFKQHILVAGATGSGKSNTVANLIKAAQAYDACVIVYDQKPDYQDIDKPNDEKYLFDNWDESTINPFGLDDVFRYALYQGEERKKGETLIAVRARDVSLGMLIEALFPFPDEGNQRDTFGALLSYYEAKHKHWTLIQFDEWLKKARQGGKKGELGKLAEEMGWGELNDKNVDAMQRKMNMRRMKWLDSLEVKKPAYVGGLLDMISQNGDEASDDSDLPEIPEGEAPQGYFNPLQHIAAGRILVIRTNASGREYSLFLTYMLRQVFDLKRAGHITCRVVNIVDEAQDIFQGGSVSSNATSTLNEIIRKGRSKDIGFVIAAQSVSQIPDSVLTNMNSRLIHRQNSPEELRKAIPSASKELLASSLTFGPGEALVSIIGARSVVHGELAPSPFELTKVSVEPRQTLADQMAEQMGEATTT